jgi:hypothetical protein
MKKFFSWKMFPVILVTIVFFTGCVSSTLIQSYPPGAKVYINGAPVGVTPYWHSDSKITGSITNVDLVKEGYETLYTSISRTEQVNVGAIIGGFFCWPVFLWTMEYNPTHNYELIPLNTEQEQIPEEVSAPIVTQSQTIPKVIPQTQTVSTKAGRLKELKQMLDDNLINKDDYEKQKQRILNEI